MAFFAPDYDDYEGERGFYFDYRSGVPGPIFETTGAGAVPSGRSLDLERVRVSARPRSRSQTEVPNMRQERSSFRLTGGA